MTTSPRPNPTPEPTPPPATVAEQLAISVGQTGVRDQAALTDELGFKPYKDCPPFLLPSFNPHRTDV